MQSWLTEAVDSCSSRKTSSGLEDYWPENINREIRCVDTHTHLQTHVSGVLANGINLERGLANQTLVDDCPNAPQVSLGVIVLGHDDLRGLMERRPKIKIQSRQTYTTYCCGELTSHF